CSRPSRLVCFNTSRYMLAHTLHCLPILAKRKRANVRREKTRGSLKKTESAGRASDCGRDPSAGSRSVSLADPLPETRGRYGHLTMKKGPDYARSSSRVPDSHCHRPESVQALRRRISPL